MQFCTATADKCQACVILCDLVIFFDFIACSLLRMLTYSLTFRELRTLSLFLNHTFHQIMNRLIVKA